MITHSHEVTNAARAYLGAPATFGKRERAPLTVELATLEARLSQCDRSTIAGCALAEVLAGMIAVRRHTLTMRTTDTVHVSRPRTFSRASQLRRY